MREGCGITNYVAASPMRVVGTAKWATTQKSLDAGFAALLQRLKQLQRLAIPTCASIYTPTAVDDRCDHCEPRFRIAALLHN